MSRIVDTLGRIRRPKRESIFLSKTKLDPFEHREVPSFWRRLWSQITFDRFIILFFVVVAVFVFAYRSGVSQRSGISAHLMSVNDDEKKEVRKTGAILSQPSAALPAPTPAVSGESVAAAPSGSGKMVSPVAVEEPEKLFFTIQLVTYKNRVRVGGEMERLSARGFEVFVIPSGDYFQLCIEKFETKNEALDELRRLQILGLSKVYPDAYVRPNKRS